MSSKYWPSLHGYMSKWRVTSSVYDLMKRLLYLILMTRCIVNRVITGRDPMTIGMIDSFIFFLVMTASVFAISDASVIVIDTSVPPSPNSGHSLEKNFIQPSYSSDLLYVS